MSVILEHRELRANHIATLMKEHPHNSIVVLKTNVAGLNKNPAHLVFICTFFNQLITSTFEGKIHDTSRMKSLDGNYFYYVIEENGNFVKEKTIELEERTELGRLVDIDVYYEKPITRQDMECEMRKCLICDNYAHICSRNQTHSVLELHTKTLEIAKDFLDDYILNITIKAIYGELELFPSFGLVSHRDNGSHTDMDYETFVKSTFAIKKYIKEYIQEGLNGIVDPKKLQEIGLRAEKSMFKATNGVNTHKGLIFLLGVFLPPLAEAIINFNSKTDVIERIKEISKTIIGDYYETIEDKDTYTHGDKIFMKHGLKGIRGEALKGLRLVFESPSRNNIDEDTSFHNYLIYFMSKLNDTTIIHRNNIETLHQVKKDMNEIIESGGYRKNLQKVYELSDLYKQKNISPGGSADMLVLKIVFEDLKFLLRKRGEKKVMN